MNILLLLLLLTSCAHLSVKKPFELSSLHLVDQNGFTETIASSDRLESFKRIDFLSPQPYQKVMRHYTPEENGAPYAYVTSYYPSGVIKQYLEVQNNRAFGLYKEFHPSGKIKIICPVVGGMADLSKEAEKSFIFDGISEAFNEKGNKIASISYFKGVLEGEYLLYYDSGGVKEKRYYKEGKKENEESFFTETGKTLSTIFYNKGKKEGKALSYTEAGDLLSEEEYQNDLLQEGTYFDLSGKKCSHIKKGSGFKTLFKNNQIIEQQEYKKGIQEGVVDQFDETGTLYHKYTVKNGLKEGEELFYYQDSKKKLSLFWVGGNLFGKVKTWYENGLLETQKEISDNKKNGPFTAWYKTGQMMFQEEYQNDHLVEGVYYRQGSLEPVSKVISGKGTATLFTPFGTLLKKNQLPRWKSGFIR